tara:strand:- start:472 stop:669 length:198 start_codon:yes stop_codon:yes gene_type:complete
MNSILDTIRNRIFHTKEAKTHVIEEDLDCEVTDEIERALLLLKEELDLSTEEVDKAIDSRKKLKK